MKNIEANNIQIAVLMSVYKNDSSDYFDLAISSILKQTYQNFKLYLYVDGPIPEMICNKINYYDAKDTRIVIIRGEFNLGLAAGLNCLIDEALKEKENKLMARMDADDICFPDRFLKQVNYYLNNPQVDIFGTECIEFNLKRNLEFHKKMASNDAVLKKQIVKRSPFVHPTVIFSRKIFESGIRYRRDTHLSEDLFLWAELARAGYIFGNVCEPLLYFRVCDELYFRRMGFKKGWSELKSRYLVMKYLGVYTPLNAAYSAIHFIVKLLPLSFVKYAYRKLR